jgi:flagellar protein FlbD
MIKLTRLDGTEFYMNPDLIECVEETPDTVITLTNDDHFIVREKARTITDRIISFKAMIIRRSSTLTKPYHLRRKPAYNSRCIKYTDEE